MQLPVLCYDIINVTIAISISGNFYLLVLINISGKHIQHLIIRNFKNTASSIKSLKNNN